MLDSRTTGYFLVTGFEGYLMLHPSIENLHVSEGSHGSDRCVKRQELNVNGQELSDFHEDEGGLKDCASRLA